MLLSSQRQADACCEVPGSCAFILGGSFSAMEASRATTGEGPGTSHHITPPPEVAAEAETDKQHGSHGIDIQEGER